jgi:hypothetical protein
MCVDRKEGYKPQERGWPRYLAPKGLLFLQAITHSLRVPTHIPGHVWDAQYASIQYVQKGTFELELSSEFRR